MQQQRLYMTLACGYWEMYNTLFCTIYPYTCITHTYFRIETIAIRFLFTIFLLPLGTEAFPRKYFVRHQHVTKQCLNIPQS